MRNQPFHQVKYLWKKMKYLKPNDTKNCCQLTLMCNLDLLATYLFHAHDTLNELGKYFWQVTLKSQQQAEYNCNQLTFDFNLWIIELVMCATHCLIEANISAKQFCNPFNRGQVTVLTSRNVTNLPLRMTLTFELPTCFMLTTNPFIVVNIMKYKNTIFLFYF